MGIPGLLTLLDENPALRTIQSRLTNANIFQDQAQRLFCLEEARPYLMASMAIRLGRVFVLTSRDEDAERLAEDIGNFFPDSKNNGEPSAPKVVVFPARNTAEVISIPTETSHKRLEVLASLARNNDGLIVISSIKALLQPTISFYQFTNGTHTLKTGDKISINRLLSLWNTLGYEMETMVNVPGTASRRGGVLDIYPPNNISPIRLELFGEVIESIRSFDQDTQLSIEELESVEIIPATESLPRTFISPDKRLADLLTTPESIEADPPRISITGMSSNVNDTVLSFFSQESTMLLDEPYRIHQTAQSLDQPDNPVITESQNGEPPFYMWSTIKEKINAFPRRVVIESLGGNRPELEIASSPAPEFFRGIEGLVSQIGLSIKNGDRVVIFSRYSEQISKELAQYDIGTRLTEGETDPPYPGAVTIIPRWISRGFVLQLDTNKLVVISDTEIFGKSKRRRRGNQKSKRSRPFVSDITPGTYVVHVDHGIGLFTGIRTISTEFGTKEYLTIEYAAGDKLSVPTEFLDRITSYFSPGEEPPSLTRLGTQEWTRLRGRAEKAALDMAKDLLDLYAAREIFPGFAFSPDGIWQQELEASFPYDETPDQLKAIEEIKADMEEPRPLDRLICGDVGFGKTEVALRAAFKAVQDGKQVAVLCPTTILAEQHNTTFQERLAAFPVKLEVITRFDSGKDLEGKLLGISNGSVDIVIGTHRLLQKDVNFNDLGLVIIDDEQRFGVAHKEQFKKFRQGLDVLSMTATPIPRTLYMALARIRDMSVIETPPTNRKATETYVTEYTDDLIRDSINRELNRGGQIFFVHNRIRDIEEWAYRIQELVPEAIVSIGHGKMDKKGLEQVMKKFTQGTIDILLCTTIIESGLDIPNANTIIINRPELMGLSQLYQLRGRVGRGERKGFAYFLQPSEKNLSEAAEKRLRAILSHQEVGAGFRVAMRDLEIRGTGNILGAQQSGHVNAVGFELYCQMLAEAVSNLEENPNSLAILPQQSILVELPIPAFLPEEFISHLPQRLGIYHRLASIFTLEDCSSIEQELIDRFGPLPEEVRNLIFVVKVKVQARTAHIESITSDSKTIILRMMQPVGGARIALQNSMGPQVRVGESSIRIPQSVGWKEMLEKSLSIFTKFRDQLLSIANESKP